MRNMIKKKSNIIKIFQNLCIFKLFILYGYIWFSENLRKNVRERKYKEKVKKKNEKMKKKNILKVNKLFVFTTSNSFYLF